MREGNEEQNLTSLLPFSLISEKNLLSGNLGNFFRSKSLLLRKRIQELYSPKTRTERKENEKHLT